MGSFTCTRVQRTEDYLIVESFLKDPWVKIGHIKNFLMTWDEDMVSNRVMGKENNELTLNILENSIHLAMNSQTFNIFDYMDSGEHGALMQEEDLRRMLISKNRYFKTSAILEGRCMAEFCFDYDDIVESIEMAEDRDFD